MKPSSFFRKSTLKGIVISLLFLVNCSSLHAVTLEELSGYFLLGDETHSEAWYVNPADQTSYYLGSLDTAFLELPTYAIGISNSDLAKIPINGSEETGDIEFKQAMAGKLLLQVEASGELWYVSPTTFERFFLANAEMAVSVIISEGAYISILDDDQTIDSPSSIPLVDELIDVNEDPIEDMPDSENGGINLFISIYEEDGITKRGYGEMAYDNQTYGLLVMFPEVNLASDLLSVYRGWVINDETGAYVYTGELTYDSGYWINDFEQDVDLSSYTHYVLTKDPILAVSPINTIYEGYFEPLS